MAHLPAFLFNPAQTSWHRYQSAAGSPTAFIGAADPGYIHASCYSCQARGAKRSRKTPSTARIGTACCNYGKQFKYKHLKAETYAFAEGVAPFCTYEGIATQPKTHLECMAGTTGLEPATSAVTVTDGFFWRCKERSGTVIEPISNPRPLPGKPLPTRRITGGRLVGQPSACRRWKCRSCAKDKDS
jgi:hypothetical protein